MSSKTGNPVQRLVYYFSEALLEKIDREPGRITSKSLGKERAFDFDEALMCPSPSMMALYEKNTLKSGYAIPWDPSLPRNCG
ncbi:hypothetical protein SLA2020_529010 [Shorea laevis]